jgi:hypothetical protein
MPGGSSKDVNRAEDADHRECGCRMPALIEFLLVALTRPVHRPILVERRSTGPEGARDLTDGTAAPSVRKVPETLRDRERSPRTLKIRVTPGLFVCHRQTSKSC